MVGREDTQKPQYSGQFSSFHSFYPAAHRCEGKNIILGGGAVWDVCLQCQSPGVVLGVSCHRGSPRVSWCFVNVVLSLMFWRRCWCEMPAAVYALQM